MEDKRYINIQKWMLLGASTILLLWSIFYGFSVQAYSPESTHPALTKETVEFYSAISGRKLEEKFIKKLTEGSADEDTLPRPVNHFYDPIYQKAWSATLVSGVPDEIVQFVSAIVLSKREPLTSKEWAYNSEEQKKYYLLYHEDKSWWKALYEYEQGNYSEAFYTLGFIMHLLQDAASPAHTRDDSHPPFDNESDPLEKWAHMYTTSNKLNVAQELISKNIEIPKFESLDEIFDYTAKYSNRYFFSEDTIFERSYAFPKVSFYQRERGSDGAYYMYGYFEVGDNIYKILKIADVRDGKAVYSVNDMFVMADYWARLSRRTVLAGAGLLDLFLREGEKAKMGKAYVPDPPKLSVLDVYYLVKNRELISPAGELQRFAKLSDLLDKTLTKLLKDIEQWVGGINPFAAQLAPQGISTGVQQQEKQVGETTEIRTVTTPEAVSEVAPIVGEPKVVEVVRPTLEPGAEVTKEQQMSGREGPRGVETATGTGVSAQNIQEVQAPQNQQETVETPPVIEPTIAGPVEVAVQPQGPSSPPPPQPPQPPIVTSPSNGSTLNQSLVSIEGIAQANGLVIITKGSQIWESSVNQQGNWTKEIVLTPGVNTFNIKAQSTQVLESESIQFSLIYGIPPQVSIQLADYKLYDINFKVQWSGQGQNPLTYSVQYKVEQNGTWQNLLSNTSLVEKSFQAFLDEKTYFFRVQATDTVSGLTSAWLESSGVYIMQYPIIINEIAWMGTGQTQSLANDEWIELYNKTNQPLDLSGWQLVAEDGTPNIILSGIIQANSFYVLERTADTTISDIQADQIYTGALADEGERLFLKAPNGRIVDEIRNHSLFWYAGDKPSRSTMERINQWIGGNTPENWATNNGVVKNGLNASGNPINGTPKAQNSAYNNSTTFGTFIDHKTIFAQDTILSKQGSPYRFNANAGESPTVNSGITLYIEPGVVIKPQQHLFPVLKVLGTLVAKGTLQEQILFTSKVPVPSALEDYYQLALLFQSPSSGSVLKYAIFEYGTQYKEMVRVDVAAVTMDFLTFRKSLGSLGYGLYLKNSSSVIKNSTFEDLLYGIVIEGNATPSPITENLQFQNVPTQIYTIP